MNNIHADFASLSLKADTWDPQQHLNALKSLMERCFHLWTHQESVILTANDHILVDKLAKTYGSLCLALHGDRSIVTALSRIHNFASLTNQSPPESNTTALESAWEIITRWLNNPVLCSAIQNALPLYVALYLQLDQERSAQGTRIPRLRSVESFRQFLRYFELEKVAASAFLLSKLSAGVQESAGLGKGAAKGIWWFSVVLSEVITRILGETDGVQAVLSAMHSGISRMELEQLSRSGRLSRLLTAVPPEFRANSSHWHRLIIPQLLHLARTMSANYPNLSLCRTTLEALAFMLRDNPEESRILFDEHVFLSMASISKNLGHESADFSIAVRNALLLMDNDIFSDELLFLRRLLADGASPLTENVIEMYTGILDGLSFMAFQSGLSMELSVKDAIVELIPVILRHVKPEMREQKLVESYRNGARALFRSLSIQSGEKYLSETEIAAAMCDLSEKSSDVWMTISGTPDTKVLTSSKSAVSLSALFNTISRSLNDTCRDLLILSSIPPTNYQLVELLSLSVWFRNLSEFLLDSEDDGMGPLAECPSFWDVFLVFPVRMRTLIPKIADEQFRGIPFAMYILVLKLVGKIVCLNGSQCKEVHQQAMGMIFHLCLNIEDLKVELGELSESISWKELNDGMHLLVAACKLSMGVAVWSERTDLTPFQQALKDTKDPLLPLRAGAYHQLRRLIISGDDEALSHSKAIFCDCCGVFQGESDSYVYLAVIQCLEATALSNPSEYLPLLLSELASFAASTRIPASAGPDPTVRGFLAENLVRIVNRLGPAAARYADKLLNTLLFLARDTDPDVRTSAISALADVGRALRFGMSAVRMEVLNCLIHTMETDPEVLNRRAAVYCLCEIVDGMGKDFLDVFGDGIKLVWSALKKARLAEDYTVRMYAERGIDVLNEVPRRMMNDSLQFMRVISEKRLKEL
ncbi:uncharacterized protein LOC129588319 [Paramacrobiotus metropolitanus]|uniref:uncharacterized protein LOC129588319 n=1 Tax=Paramacrobiotus metropolitanus TaxID=2943436 RepID=UPI002446458F|nr:uncharacterized protein LOC129588319 [Paramacrobiotus metropolitanus]